MRRKALRVTGCGAILVVGVNNGLIGVSVASIVIPFIWFDAVQVGPVREIAG